eukprot:scaffold36275_cov154-Isochrysis_galbana.AAC.2
MSTDVRLTKRYKKSPLGKKKLPCMHTDRQQQQAASRQWRPLPAAIPQIRCGPHTETRSGSRSLAGLGMLGRRVAHAIAGVGSKKSSRGPKPSLSVPRGATYALPRSHASPLLLTGLDLAPTPVAADSCRQDHRS